MALSDKLNTIDTIENLATNRDFLGKLITELSKGANNAGIYTKKGVDDELKKKADRNYVDIELRKKANSADLAAKANTTDVYTKTDADTAFVKATELKTKAAAKDVVDAIFDAKDGNNKISEIKIGATFAKKNASNLTDAANQKAFAEAILPAKDGNKSILVDKLEGFLAENAKAYSNNTKTAKELLVPSAADLVQDHDFKQGIEKSIKEMAVSSNSDFQKNVREVMSQPHFDIPASDDAALNWTW